MHGSQIRGRLEWWCRFMKKIQWLIACPKCQKKLKIEDHSLLGRRGQCPNCGHKFPLEISKSSGFAPKPSRDVDLETKLADDTQKNSSSADKPRKPRH